MTSDVVSQVNAGTTALFAAGLDAGTYVTRAFAFISKFLPTEMNGYGAHNAAKGELDACFDRYPTGLWNSLEAYGQLMHKYEAFRFDPKANGGRPYSVREYYTQGSLHDLDLFQEVHAPLGFEDNCFLHVPTKEGATLFFGLFREGTFNERDLQMLAVAQPFLIDAHRLALAQTANSGLPTTPDALVRAGYTTRESEVLYWLMQGLENHEIAAMMHIHLGTVRSLLCSIYEKMEVRDRVSARIGALNIIRQIVMPAPFRVSTEGVEPARA